MSTILILNGPNLNMLGVREPEIYGTQTLFDIEMLCKDKAGELGLHISFRQSNHEGELVTWIQEAHDKVGGIIINAAAYTHTSIAILDALKLHSCPVVEVHLSDIHAREAFRKHSYVSMRADHMICGKQGAGYIEALEWLAQKSA